MGYENFYEGSKSGLEPGSDSIYTGASVPSGGIGGTTSIQTANQITEVTNMLNTGMKSVEVSTINPEVFEMIPKMHLKEIQRLSELTKAEISMHAPMIEPSGFTQQGWNEQNRELAERQLTSTVIRAHDLSPNKPMPITIHSTGVPGTETMPASMIKNLTEEEKKMYGERIPVQMIVVNQETGELQGLKREEKYDMMGKKEIWLPVKQIDSANHTRWIKELTNLEFYKKEADIALSSDKAEDNTQRAQLFLNDVETSLRSIFERAVKYGDEGTKEKLNDVSSNWKQFAVASKNSNPMEFLHLKSKLIGDTIHQLAAMDGPELVKPIEQFATEKASQTFANVAFAAWDKFKGSAPIISIENPPYGTAISTGEDLKKLIEESRKKLAEKIQKERGLSSDEAKKAAAQMIGATWDTSHISMMRKQGYGGKELIAEAKTIAPFVKHVHLNDNLGFTHTDLPPGMGDVPIGEIMKELQKKGFKGKNIFEGGNFFQHFKTSPHPMVLEAMGSPIYAVEAQPTWTKTYGTMGVYSSGYGPFLPEQNFAIYGGGFSGLPQELGGQIPGKQSRFAGTPMN